MPVRGFTCTCTARLRWCITLLLLMPGLLLPAMTHARSLQEILDSKELRVCLVPIHPSVASVEPANCTQDCRFSGPALEAAQAFAQFLGEDLALRAVRVDWDEQFFNNQGRTVREAEYVPALLESGQCDLYPNNLSKNAWRLSKMDIVTMFTNRPIVLVHAQSRESVRGPSDLGGKAVVVEKDTSYHTWLQAQNKTTFAADPMNIRLMPTEQALNTLARGEADFTILDADAIFWVLRNQFPELHMAFPVGTMEEVGWGLRKSDTQLRQAVARFFHEQRGDPDSALHAIWKRHFGMDLNQFISLLGSIQE